MDNGRYQTCHKTRVVFKTHTGVDADSELEFLARFVSDLEGGYFVDQG